MAPTAERTSNQSALFTLPHVQPANITRRRRCIKPVDGSDSEEISLWQYQKEPSGGKLYCTLLHKPYAGRFGEVRACGIYRPLAGLGAKRQLLRSDESDIGDAYKAQ